MYPNSFKVSHMRIWVMLALAAAFLLPALASTPAYAQTASGEFCIKGEVIDHEEEPLADWEIRLTGESGEYQALSADKDRKDDDEEPNGDLAAEDAPPAEGDVAAEDAPPAEEMDSNNDNHKLRKGEFKFEDLMPGTYIASIVLQEGWEPVTPESFEVPLEVGNEHCVRIRFKVRQVVKVTVYKISADHERLPDWKIIAQPGHDNTFAETQHEKTEENGAAVFYLTPGVWVFSERPPKPDDHDEDPVSFDPVLPDSGRVELDVQPLERGEPPYIVVFKNEFKDNGCIVVRKLAVLPAEAADVAAELAAVEGAGAEGETAVAAIAGYGAGGWGIKLLRADDSVAAYGTTDAEGYITFEDLPYGPYTIAEETRAGWEDVTPRKLDVDVIDGVCQYVEFQNEQADTGYCIEGRKIDANGHYGIPGWEIKAKPRDKGGYEPENVFTNGLGEFEFEFPTNDYRIPGSTYEVCEDDQDGWVAQGKTCQTVTLPERPGACVYLEDFVNQQVGHSEDYGKDGKGDNHDAYGKDVKCATYHVVQPGEGLASIGQDYGVPYGSMLDANEWVYDQPNMWVFAGQRVCVPEGGRPTADGKGGNEYGNAQGGPDEIQGGGKAMPGGPQQGGPEQYGPEQYGPQQGGPEQGGPEQYGLQQGGPQQGGPEQGPGGGK